MAPFARGTSSALRATCTVKKKGVRFHIIHANCQMFAVFMPMKNRNKDRMNLVILPVDTMDLTFFGAKADADLKARATKAREVFIFRLVIHRIRKQLNVIL